jgi:hypothetical protein
VSRNLLDLEISLAPMLFFSNFLPFKGLSVCTMVERYEGYVTVVQTRSVCSRSVEMNELCRHSTGLVCVDDCRGRRGVISINVSGRGGGIAASKRPTTTSLLQLPKKANRQPCALGAKRGRDFKQRLTFFSVEDTLHVTAGVASRCGGFLDPQER